MELIIVLLIALFIIVMISQIIDKSSKKKRSNSSVTFNDEVVYKAEVSYGSHVKLDGKPGKWFNKSEDTYFKNYNIPGGMVYVGEVLLDDYGYDNDACLINPKLDVISSQPWEHGDQMGYWPRYNDISPECRGSYLQWLSTGRSHPDTYIGYIFLFFYGLERRLFIDGQKDGLSENERHDIVNEVRQLLKIYGENRSFRGYANNFLAMEWVLYQSSAPIPNYIDLSDRYCQGVFQVVLAQYVVSQKPIPADIALIWVTIHPDFGVRTPARRCPEEFQELFAQYYKEQYGEGLVVKPNKTPLKLSYHPANASLRGTLNLSTSDLPNPFILTGKLKQLDKIVEKCTIALEPYSRYVGRIGNTRDSFKALSLLPSELIMRSSIADKVLNYLNNNFSAGPQLVGIDQLYELFEEDAPMKINIKEAESLAKLLEGMGFGIIPDSRFYNIKPTAGGQVVIFPKGHGIDFKPSREFHTMGSILRLGAMVSQIDDDVSAAEEETLQSLIIDNRELTNIEKDSLVAFLYWSLRTPQSITGLKQKLAVVSKEEKVAIGHILISIAKADGYIDNKEIKQIEKLYLTLGLDKTQVSSDIHSLISKDEPITVAVKNKNQSYSIPTSSRDNTQVFSLNEEVIKIREMETQQVKGVLEGIFDNDEVEIEENNDDLVITNPLLSLDQIYQDLLNILLTKETWKKDVLHKICKDLDLMVDGALEVLNEWAFEYANAPLIEDGELVYIDIELAKEILDDQ